MKWKETGMPDPRHYRKKNDDEEFEKKLIQKKEKSIKERKEELGEKIKKLNEKQKEAF